MDAMDDNRDELDPTLHSRIVAIAAEADRRADEAKFYEALVLYNDALALVPEPKTKWNASTWLLGSIGDAAFQGNYYETARDALQDAMLCPDAIGNPFLHLRLGETEFELGDSERAVDELMRAYMGAGKDIFEHEDPKYLALLREHAVLPD